MHPVGRQPDANFIQPATSGMQISFSWPPAGCKFHSIGSQPDANCIRLASMQYKIPKFITSLHAAGHQANEICIRLVASWMQIKFASVWWPAGCKFCGNKQLAHCKAASVLQARCDDILLKVIHEQALRNF
jgi:hypothetical protein